MKTYEKPFTVFIFIKEFKTNIMKNKNQIGLDSAGAEKLTKGLNILLANYQLFYINTRGFHWNITGQKFFELHIKFEEMYTDALLKIDEIAERVVTLGHTPLHSYTDYLKIADIKEQKNVSDGIKAVGHIVKSLRVLIDQERELLELSDKIGDEGTNSLMSDYLVQQEKFVWMYSSYLKK